MTEDIKTNDERELFTVSVRYTEKVATQFAVLAEDAEHAKKLGEEIIANKEDSEITDIEAFDAFEQAKIEAKMMKTREEVMAQIEEARVAIDEEDSDPTIN